MPISVKLSFAEVPQSFTDFMEKLKIRVRTQGREALVEGTIWHLIYADVTAFFTELPRLRTNHKCLKRASMKQEQKSAEALGGRRQTGSGSRVGHKGDGRVRGRYRIENRFTTAQSHPVKLADLRKIRAECEGLEVPIYDVQFKEKVTLRTIDNWVLIPREHFERLAHGIADAEDDC